MKLKLRESRSNMAVARLELVWVTWILLIAMTSGRILEEERVVDDGAESPVVGPSVEKVSFFMQDILGGSNPTARAVTGVVTNPALNAQVAFAKPNGVNIHLNNGVPQNNNNGGILNNNNLPFLTGLGGTTGNVFNNRGNNYVNGGGIVTNTNELPQGMTLQKVMFGTMTVFDDEVTEGYELGSGLVGKAQGFYIASSVDGTSQVMAFTVKFQDNGYVDSLSFFGVHRTQVSESQIAIIGGTGKYLNSEGYAIIKTFPATPHNTDTDGVHTLLHLTAYLSH